MTKKVDKQIAETSEKLSLLRRLKKQLFEEAHPVASDLAVGHISDMTDKWPQLVALMTCHLEEGGPDEGATLILWGDEGGLGCLLNVKPLGRKLFAKSECLQGVLDELERAIGDPNTRWVADRNKARRQRPKQRTGKPH